MQAIVNLHGICERYLGGRYDLEVVDIYHHPEVARAFRLVAAPTLLRLRPAPLRRIVGDLSDRSRVLAQLGIVPQRGDAAGSL
jgi:circadian clock protein KaiB